MNSPPSKRQSVVFTSYVAFAVFGLFWGTWGASIPRLRSLAEITDGQLGTALLFIGVGALPAMLLTGRAIDRIGLRLSVATSTLLLGLSGLIVAQTTSGFVSLCLGLLMVGAASGTTDVAINSAAGAAESRAGRPVITRAHGVFSVFVVVSSLGAGVLTRIGGGLSLTFSVVLAASVVAAAYVLSAQRTVPDLRGTAGSKTDLADEGPDQRIPIVAVLLVGLMGALAFANENAHQSWAAVFFEDELSSGAALSSVAPAVFAGVVAITRFSVGGLPPAHATQTVAIGATVAGAGAVILAMAPSLVVAIVGLAVAAAGTAVLYPTLLGIVSRSTSEATRGRATSLLTSVSYLGFLLGPVYVGLWSESVGLRGAIIAVAGLCLLLLVIAPSAFRAYQRLTAPSEVLDRGETP